jgi:acylphosphatase
MGADRSTVAVLVTVHGRVQGVFFRDSTRQVAMAAGARGWVRNRRDGTVQVHVEGSRPAVDAVLAFVRSGPPGARVTGVDVADAAPAQFEGFEIR